MGGGEGREKEGKDCEGYSPDNDFLFIADRIISGQTENSVWLTLSAIIGHNAVHFAISPVTLRLPRLNNTFLKLVLHCLDLLEYCQYFHSKSHLEAENQTQAFVLSTWSVTWHLLFF